MKYIFYLAKHYAVPIFKPLVTYLEETGESYRFYTSQKVKDNFPPEWNREFLLQDLKAAKSFSPDFVLSPGNYVDFRIPGIKVQIFHGLGIEKPAHYKIRHFFDLYLTSGPVVTERFLKLRKANKDYFEVRETGWPKIDYILNYPNKAIKEQLSLPEDKKIVLYAPTFSNTMESASHLVTDIEAVISADEFWLFKFHEFMDKEVIEQFKLKALPNVRIVETTDITPYLHAADIMISDTSSVIYEFMALGKPVITINTLARKDKGIDICQVSELKPALQKLKNNPKLLMENISKNLKEVNPYLDGKIAERVFTTLSEIATEQILPKKNKPKYLLRKLKIIQLSLTRKGYLK